MTGTLFMTVTRFSTVAIFAVSLLRTVTCRGGKQKNQHRYYKQPGHLLHPMSKKGGRFSKQKGMETWDPKDPKGENQKRNIRDLEEL